MVDWFMFFGAMCIPLTVILRIEMGTSWVIYMMLAIGIFTLTWGGLIAWIREKRIIREQNKSDRVECNRFLAQQELLSEILKTLKSLNANLTDGKNGNDRSHKSD
jgi:flagellar basal body-associated protein FliL